jgi:hypothetical protein
VLPLRARGVRSTVFEPVHGCAASILEPLRDPCHDPLDPSETRVDVLPARPDQIDEQRKVVDSRMRVRLGASFECLEAPDDLIQQASDLREVAPDGSCLLSQAVVHSRLDSGRQRRSRRGGGVRKGSELRPRTLEHRVESGGVRALLDALLCPLDCALVHGWRL